MKHYFYYYPEAQILLLNDSEEKNQLIYNGTILEVPKIGPRPPYYCNPGYDQYYPKI
ncbi:hypothetical protein [Sutcliffiella sp. NC1]|uniref:hypothetical protein n=1 Tax=Sutcliffiella sp. NC1 TaxID=3004096 RepID=UPI0022DE3B6A|nr:hypothetical protein [Sutcliffiella sp. NC1]WBL13734.1 hypothetical protein O1A01_17690 [Sutcliffiella sp. NC1]